MRFQVTVFSDALYTLSRMHQVKLARRAARKAMRMGSSSAIVIFPGPRGLRVTVNCLKGTIVITKVPETAGQKLRRSA